MYLIRIRREIWDVLVVSADGEGAQVLDFLFMRISSESMARKMLATLREHVPVEGPPIHNKKKASHLRDHISELKNGPKRGAKIRVLYFRDDKSIVCTEALVKDTKMVPPIAIDRAVRAREQYFKDKARDRLVVTEMEDC